MPAHRHRPTWLPWLRPRRRGHTLLALALVVAVSACKSNEARTDDPAHPSGTLIVFAAASLTDVFNALADDFEKAHPAVTVRMSFAGSQNLRAQIENGAQPQVFASANATHMDALRTERLVDAPVIFAHNELVVVVPAANPARISSLAELPEADRIVVAGANVPAGAYTARMLANASSVYGDDFARRVDGKVVSRETNVRQTLQKVVLGEADAAIVYATDAIAAGDEITIIQVPAEHNVTASYPIARVTGSARPHMAQLFVDFVCSDAGSARLRAHGFRPASGPAGE